MDIIFGLVGDLFQLLKIIYGALIVMALAVTFIGGLLLRRQNVD